MSKIILLFTLLFLVVNFPSQGAEPKIAKLSSMVEEINLQPWSSYQKLISLESSFTSLDDEGKLWFLLRKAQAENLLYFYSDFAVTVQSALALMDEDMPIELISSFNFYQGIIFQRKSQYKEAINFFLLAMKQAKKIGLTHLYVQIKQELAYTKSLYENFAISLADLQESYIEAFALQDDLLVGIINENYGAIYGYMQEYEKSIEYYQKALAIYQRLKYRAHIAEAIYGLASTYRYWGKYELAIEQFKLYRDVVNYTPNQDIIFFSVYGLGMTLAEKGDCPEAIIIIEQAILLNGAPDYNAELYKRKAQCLLTIKQLDNAQVTLQLAADIFESLPELLGTRWQLEVMKIASEIAYAQGNIDKAYQLITDYYQQYTQVMKVSSSERLAGMRIRLEFEQKNIEIAFLQQRTQVQKLEVEKERQRNQNQQYLLLFVVLLTIVITVVVLIQRHNNKKVYALSIKDALSNLYNRRYVFNFLKSRLHADVAHKSQLSIILLDIDDFKEINDKYGHPFGDSVIRKIAEIGQLTLRAEDVMGRIGGEEFLCVLPRIDAVQSLRIAKRLLTNIDKFSFVFDSENSQTQVNITVSIGISHAGAEAEHNEGKTEFVDSATLYSQADQALYHAKSIGKNSVVEYSQII